MASPAQLLKRKHYKVGTYKNTGSNTVNDLVARKLTYEGRCQEQGHEGCIYVVVTPIKKRVYSVNVWPLPGVTKAVLQTRHPPNHYFDMPMKSVINKVEIDA